MFWRSVELEGFDRDISSTNRIKNQYRLSEIEKNKTRSGLKRRIKHHIVANIIIFFLTDGGGESGVGGDVHEEARGAVAAEGARADGEGAGGQGQGDRAGHLQAGGRHGQEQTGDGEGGREQSETAEGEVRGRDARVGGRGEKHHGEIQFTQGTYTPYSSVLKYRNSNA